MFLLNNLEFCVNHQYFIQKYLIISLEDTGRREKNLITPPEKSRIFSFSPQKLNRSQLAVFTENNVENRGKSLESINWKI